MKNILKIFISLTLLFSCKEEEKSNNYFELVKIENNLFHYKLTDKYNNEIRIILDSNSQLYQIDNLNSLIKNKFKVVLSNNNIKFIENETKNCSEQLFIKTNENSILYKLKENGFLYENLLINPKNPLVSFLQIKTEENGNFYSSNKVFDFSTMTERQNEYTSHIINLFDNDNLVKNKINKIKFRITSKFDSHILINSNFTKTFESNSKLDSLKIDKNFTINYFAKTKNDTIRFIVYCFNKKDTMGHSIFYELPIKSN